MNKTISVNIGGRVFNIEEAAYDQLYEYLNAIRAYFKGREGAEEILSDIELRVAELFLEQLNDQKQVITSRDVEHIKVTMGRVEDYMDQDTDEPFQQPGSQHESAKYQKRVFRDPDNKVIFGVCGGISAYFGWDPIWLRLLFVALVVFFGTGVLLYLILGLIIPMAKTTAEKLQMRGEPVTVHNISKKVSESFDEVKEDLNQFTSKNNPFFNQLGAFIANILKYVASAAAQLARILVKILGILFIIAGITLLFFALMLVVGWETIGLGGQSGIFWDHNLAAIAHATYEGSHASNTSFTLGVLLTTAMPALGLLLLGVKVLFNKLKHLGWWGLGILIFWFIGVGLLAYTGMRVARGFQIETDHSERLEIEWPDSDTLYLDIESIGSHTYAYASAFNRGSQHFFPNGVTFPGIDSTNIMYMGNVKFTVKEVPGTDHFELELQRKAHGSSLEEADENAKAIKTHFSFRGDTLLIHPNYVIPKSSNFRNQKAMFMLSIPAGKAIYFTENSKKIIWDVPNITNTYDSQMINHTWLMTQDGLSCTDCLEEQPQTIIDIKTDSVEVRISKKQISISS